MQTTETMESTATRPNGWLMLLAAAFPSAIGLDITLQLHVRNASDLTDGVPALVEVAALWLGLWLLLFSGLRWGGRIGMALWLLASAYTVFFLVRDMVFPPPFGEFDGGSLPRLPQRYVIGEIVTLAAALGGLCWLGWRRSAPIAAIGAGVFGLSALLAAAKTQPAAQPSAAAPARSATLAPDQPDVYHVVFDSWQPVEYDFVRQTKGQGPFEDFIYFSDTICNFNFTQFSMPSFMTGVRYDPRIPKFHGSQFDRGLYRSFAQAGYQVKTYNFFPMGRNSPYVHSWRYSKDIRGEMSRQLGLARCYGGALLELVGVRLLPSRLAVRWAQPAEADIPPAASAYYSVMMFREMIDELKRSPAGGTYRYLHLMLPHAPFLMDENGNYHGRDRASRYEQVLLVENLVRELIVELKRLNRYDRSVLLLHSDHGEFIDNDLRSQCLTTVNTNGRERLAMRGCRDMHPLPNGWDSDMWRELEPKDWPLGMVISRSRAVWLLKPAGHQGYRVVPEPAELIDLPRTLLGSVGLPAPAEMYPHGLDLLAHPPGMNRVRSTWVMDNKKKMPSQEYIIERGQYRRGALIDAED